jgi:hypothetical protein
MRSRPPGNPVALSRTCRPGSGALRALNEAEEVDKRAERLRDSDPEAVAPARTRRSPYVMVRSLRRRAEFTATSAGARLSGERGLHPVPERDLPFHSSSFLLGSLRRRRARGDGDSASWAR